VVVLETPSNAIGPARLDAIGADGSIRSVALDRVVAGATWPQDGSGDPLGTQREAALAVDPDGYRAYVVQPDGPAAEIALRTLAVSYHELSAPRSALRRFSDWFAPAAAAKGMNGPRRTAVWLGDGLLAVTGSDDHSVRKSDSSIEMGVDPAGLAIVDTRDWSIQRLDPGADTVTVADGVLLATGRRLAPGQDTPTGMGLAAYGADRSLRFRLFQGASSWVVRALGGRAYVESGIGQETIAVVDLGSGKVLEQRPGPLAAPLLDDAPVG
jgi:DNA-binding beta-propeller fold protein YncE